MQLTGPEHKDDPIEFLDGDGINMDEPAVSFYYYEAPSVVRPDDDMAAYSLNPEAQSPPKIDMHDGFKLDDTYTDEKGWSASTNIAVNEAAFEQSPAGIYRYVISENTNPESKIDGMIYSKTQYIADVYKLRKTGAGESGFEYKLLMYRVINKADSDEIDAEATFAETNKCYVADFTNDWSSPSGEYGTRTVTLANEVSGNMADPTDTFDFTFYIISSETEYYRYRVSDQEEWLAFQSNETGTAENDLKKITLPLTPGQTVQICGLSCTDHIFTSQASAANDGYTTTVKAGQTGDNSENWTAEGKLFKDLTNLNTNMTILYSNEKKVEGPTGLLIEYGPYLAVLAAGLVVAGIVCMKRRSIEN